MEGNAEAAGETLWSVARGGDGGCEGREADLRLCASVTHGRKLTQLSRDPPPPADRQPWNSQLTGKEKRDEKLARSNQQLWGGQRGAALETNPDLHAGMKTSLFRLDTHRKTGLLFKANSSLWTRGGGGAVSAYGEVNKLKRRLKTAEAAADM